MTQQYDPAGPSATRTRRGLVAVWAAMTALAVGFVGWFGPNVPHMEEWGTVPALTGHVPLGPWLWEQHNEHRFVLPRAVYYALFAATHDFRGGMLAQVAMMSAVAWGMMRTAARLRGRPAWADVFFPVTLLHPGHWENVLMGYQVCFALFAVFAAGLAVTTVRADDPGRTGRRVAVLLWLLALTGGTGMVVVPPVAGWLVVLAVGLWRSGRRGEAVGLLVAVSVLGAYLTAYLVGYERPPPHPVPGTGGWGMAMVAGEVLAVGFGVGVAGVWWLVAVGVAGLAAVTAWGLAKQKAVGPLAVLAGFVGVAVAVGVGRGGMGADMGLRSRYALLGWPVIALLFLLWAGRGGRRVPNALAVTAALALPFNVGTGIVYGSELRDTAAALVADYGTGSADGVAAAAGHLSSIGLVWLGLDVIPMMRDADVGAFGPSGGTGGRLLLAAAGFAVAGWVGWRLWRFGRAVGAERARELFRLQHERFEEQLLHAAADAGKPRGLHWTACHITGDALLVRERADGGLVALVPVVIRFEPDADGDMADVPAAKEPRPATAVFRYHAGGWRTDGRVVFNLDPRQTADRGGAAFELLGH